MQVNVNSANISIFRVLLDFDIYNRKATFQDISTYAGSSGSGLFNILGISFLLKDQEGVELASIDFTDSSKYIVPSIIREFEIDLSQLSYAFLFQTYSIQAAIKDANGAIYYTDVVYKKVCQPQNITESGYVPGIFQVSANCTDNVISVKELTALVYNNQTPDVTTKTGSLSYPTGTISAVAFTGTPFSNNIIYTGQYRITCTTVSQYDLGDDVTVYVTYLTNNVFDITCTNKIADLICCMVELQNTATKYCNTAQGRNAKQQLEEITLPFLLGLTKEINGQDASTEAALIKKVLNCDCGASSIRQNEFTPINPSVTNIVLVGVAGTTIPSPTVNGNTKTYNITSSVYQVVKGNTGDLAFTIQTDTSTANIVKYKITFNYNTMASYILSAISGDANLIQQLNSLVTFSGNVDLSGLDGKCIIDLSVVNYYLTQNVTASTKVVSLTSGVTTYSAPPNLFASSAATVQSWLNGLGVGTFVVTYSGGIFSVLSLNNSNQLSAIVFSNPDLTVVFQSTNATLVSVLQAVIDYLCALTSLQVALGNTITLWQIDYNGNAQSASYTSGQTQAVLNQGVADSIYNIVQTLLTLTGVTCAKIQSIFQDYASTAFGVSDRIYGTLGGNCASLTSKQIALLVIAAINSDSDVKSAYCAIDCDTPATCPDISNTNLAMSGSNIGIYGVTWGTTPVATQTVSVKYRVNGSSTWLVSTNALQVLANGNLSGSTPYVITGVTAGVTYDVQIINNCGGVGYIKQITVPTGSIYTGSYLVDNILYLICGNSTITLYSGVPFAPGVVMYSDASLTVLATGYSYIADNTGEIYTINTSTAVVGASTASSCDTGIAGDYILGNNTGTVCTLGHSTLYTNGAFATGGVLYLDSGLTSPVTGYAYVVKVSNLVIYNLNSITGTIGTTTGLSCSDPATSTLTLNYAGGAWTANLSAAIVSTNVNIAGMLVQGTDQITCVAYIESDLISPTMTIAAGATSASQVNNGLTCATVKYRLTDATTINGTALVSGGTIMVGGTLVTVTIQNLLCTIYPC